MANNKIYIDNLEVIEEGYLTTEFPKYEGEINVLHQDILKQIDLTLELNQVELFSLQNSKSLFYKRNINDIVVSCINDVGIEIWKGNVSEVSRNYNNRISTVKATSIFNKIMATVVEYYGIGINPISAIKELLTLYDLYSYIGTSFEYAINFFDNKAITIDIQYLIKNNKTLANVINEIAKLCVVDVFIDTNNKIQIKVFDKDQITFYPILTIEKEHLLSSPVFSESIENIINDFNIQISGGTKLTDILGIGKQSKKLYGSRVLDSFTFDNQSPIIISSADTAFWIGESYIEKYRNPATIIDLEIDRQLFENYLELGLQVSLNIDDFENYNDKTFEIVKLSEINDKTYGVSLRQINITPQTIKQRRTLTSMAETTVESLKAMSKEFLRDYFWIDYVSTTQMNCGFSFPSDLIMPDNWRTNLQNQVFTLDITYTTYAKSGVIGGIVDGSNSLMADSFYQVMIFFDAFNNFVGLGLVRSNKSTTSGAVLKQNASQDITLDGTNLANFWDDSSWVQVQIYQDTTYFLTGEAKRKDSNTLEIRNTNNTWGTAISSGTTYIYQDTKRIRQKPVNSNGVVIAAYWIPLTGGIYITSISEIRPFYITNEGGDFKYFIGSIDTSFSFGTSYQTFSLFSLLPQSTKEVKYSIHIDGQINGVQTVLEARGYFQDIVTSLERYERIILNISNNPNFGQSTEVNFPSSYGLLNFKLERTQGDGVVNVTLYITGFTE